ncbi:hypothetical protein [Azorhizobium caulinodans]|uniref:hypothetical protein n=1 Tax=Azorhizobium caulinodans TaxID=7 RepID=UPI002FBEDA98
MPNWITNLIVATGQPEDLLGLAQHFVPDEDGNLRFDFETFIAMPDVVVATTEFHSGHTGLAALGIELGDPDIPRSSISDLLQRSWAREAGITSQADLLEHLKAHDATALVAAERLVACHEATGCVDWYDWSVRNWGTKWNAALTSVDDLEPDTRRILFDTALSMPEPIFRELGRRHPQLEFDIYSLDLNDESAIEGAVAGECATFRPADVSEIHEVIFGYPPEGDDDEAD